GREGDRGRDGLQIARRHGDDQAPGLAVVAALQCVGDGVDMPVVNIGGPRGDCPEGAGNEDPQILSNGEVDILLAEFHGSYSFLADFLGDFLARSSAGMSASLSLSACRRSCRSISIWTS